VDTIDQQQIDGLTIRRLAAQDFDAVVGMDAAAVGHSRASYFERRLKKAQSRPALYVQFGAEQNGKLVGFMMARQIQGQFGRNEPALRLETFTVETDMRGQQIGSALLSKLKEEAGRLKIAEIRTMASWRDHSIVRFLDHAGFELGSELVVDCQVTDQRLAVHKGNNFEALARDKVSFSTLKPDDLYDIVRIDMGITGQRREAFFYELVDEAMRDSAVRVSLVARIDGKAVGFVMARTSLGDYGRSEPVAVLDTIGIDPEYSKQGIGHALLSQLFSDLDGLGVERVETVVANKDFQLLRFFYNVGLKPSQRLAFVKRMD
jgi:predicted N-acetyltransferase YhbS